MNRKDFCVFILSHGRPDRVYTLKTLNRHGYTGDWYIIIDNEDKYADEYIQNYGKEKIIIFDKLAASKKTDQVDNFDDRRSPVHCRNECFDIAKELGYKYFVELDDDYDSFRWRMSPEIEYSSKMLSTETSYRSLDKVFDVMLDYFEATPNLICLCMAQSGDYIGGGGSKMITDQYRRKIMNSFICSVDRRFYFTGTQNDDVNTYLLLSHRGELTLTTAYVSLNQKTTQQNKGGLSELYLETGTYVKTFYSVIVHPSGVKVSVLYNTSARKEVGPKTNQVYRIHHRVDWNSTAPKILREGIKKT